MTIFASRGILLYCCCVAAVLGAALGSFLNCAAWRIAHEEPFWKGRSRCPACGHTLGVPDLVPVLSWLLLRGKCRHCGERISPRYPITEVFFAAVTVACLLRFDLTVLGLRNWLFLCCLFCLSLVDLECYIIPDGCLLLSAGVWLAALPLAGLSGREIVLHLLAAVGFGGGTLLVSLAMDALLGRESLGGGDIKLFAVMGLYLGPAASLFALVLACVLGLLFQGLRKTLGTDNKLIPFGPAIAAATALMLLWGDGLVHWYLGILGL